MYELGLAHGMRKPVVLLTQSIESAPFDLRAYRMTSYSPDFKSVTKLIEVIKEIGRGHKNGEVSFGSPVTDFAPIETMAGETVVVESREDDIKSESQVVEGDLGPGILDFQQQFIDVSEDLTQRLESIGESTQDFARNLDARVVALNDLDPNDPNLIKRRVATAASISKMISELAKKLQLESDPIRTSWEQIEEATDGFILESTIVTEEDKQAAHTLIDVISAFVSEVQTSIDALDGAKAEITPLASISRDLRGSVPQLTRAMDAIRNGLILGKSFGVRVISVLEDRLGEQS